MVCAVRRFKIRLASLTVALLFVCGISANTEISALLEEADEVRSSNIPKLTSILSGLALKRSSMTLYQDSQYQYLSAYQKSISGNYQAALDEVSDLFERSEFIDVKYRAAHLIMSNYSIQRDFYNGALFISKMDDLKQDVTDQTVLFEGQLGKMVFYQEAGQYSLAMKAASTLFRDEMAQRHECIVRSVLVESSRESRSDLVSLDFITQSELLCESISESVWGGLISINKAQSLSASDDAIAALETLDRVQSSILLTQYPRLIAQYYAARANVLFTLNDLIDAKEHAAQTLEYSQQAEFNKPAVQAYFLLAQIEKQFGNYAKALEYNEQYIKADNAFTHQQKNNLLAFQRAQFESELNEKALALVSTANELLAAETAAAKQDAQNSVIIALLSTAALAVMLVGLYRTNKIKKKFKVLSETDSLTSLKNRRQFYLEANTRMRSRVLRNKKASFIIFDLDLFKTINDQYGHAVGDWTLVKVAEVVKNACRQRDVLGRLGGEEFGLFLSDCDKQHALALAEHLRELIAGIDTSVSGHKFKITASFGVAEASMGSNHDLDTLFSQSDTALYKSKNNGRNCVYCYSDINLAT